MISCYINFVEKTLEKENFDLPEVVVPIDAANVIGETVDERRLPRSRLSHHQEHLQRRS